MRSGSTSCSSGGAASVPARTSSRSARGPDRRLAGCSTSGRARSSPWSPIQRSPATYDDRSANSVEVREVALEDAELATDVFDLAVAASSFHWVEETRGLENVVSALRPDGWWAM